MPETLILKKTDVTPGVILNQENGTFSISGRSIMEDALEFYLPLIEWVKEYAKNPNPVTDFVLDIEYLNSASTRKLLNLVVELEKIYEKGNEIKVIWRYEESDDVMKERGEEMQSVVELPFELQATN